MRTPALIQGTWPDRPGACRALLSLIGGLLLDEITRPLASETVARFEWVRLGPDAGSREENKVLKGCGVFRPGASDALRLHRMRRHFGPEKQTRLDAQVARRLKDFREFPISHSVSEWF